MFFVGGFKVNCYVIYDEIFLLGVCLFYIVCYVLYLFVRLNVIFIGLIMVIFVVLICLKFIYF